MHVVALNSLPAADPTHAKALGAALGVTAYEARARLVVPGGGPVVVATVREAAEAEALSAKLSRAGFEPLVLDTARVPGPRLVARHVELGDAARFVARGGAEQIIDWSEVGLILRATGIELGEETETEEKRRFSAGRAMLSGGLMLTKKTTRTTTHKTEVWSGLVAVYPFHGPSVLIRETDALYDGPGRPAQPTRQATFAHIIERLRAGARSARYDDRLMRRAGQIQLLGRTLQPERHLDVALAVLAQALAP